MPLMNVTNSPIPPIRSKSTFSVNDLVSSDNFARLKEKLAAEWREADKLLTTDKERADLAESYRGECTRLYKARDAAKSAISEAKKAEKGLMIEWAGLHKRTGEVMNELSAAKQTLATAYDEKADTSLKYAALHTVIRDMEKEETAAAELATAKAKVADEIAKVEAEAADEIAKAEAEAADKIAEAEAKAAKAVNDANAAKDSKDAFVKKFETFSRLFTEMKADLS